MAWTQLSSAVHAVTVDDDGGAGLVIAVVSSPAFQLDAPRETDHSASRFALGRFIRYSRSITTHDRLLPSPYCDMMGS